MVKATANARRFVERTPACVVDGEAEPARGKSGILPQRLREARFTLDFCRAVFAHLDPSTVCSTAAAQLNDYFQFRLAIFSFAAESELECVSYLPMPAEGGVTALQCQALGRLPAGSTLKAATRHSSGILGAEISLALPAVQGELRLYQVEEGAQKLSRVFLTGIAECLATALGKARDHNKMRELALRDAMTGLFNRRAFEELLAIEAGRRESGPLSLLMIDIDNFKSINDRYGHPAGDEVIAAVGRAIGEECRGGDLAARYGGEEFAVLLPGAAATNAAGVAERIRGRIASLGFNFSYEDFTVTGSFGVACRQEAQGSASDLVREADSALYAAKRSGKNRVLVHDALVVDHG